MKDKKAIVWQIWLLNCAISKWIKKNNSLQLMNYNKNAIFLVLRMLAQIILAITKRPAKPVSHTKGIVVCVLQDTRVRLAKVVRNMQLQHTNCRNTSKHQTTRKTVTRFGLFLNKDILLQSLIIISDCSVLTSNNFGIP